MACVILPSETARLVYGYLVKENLNDIALQFLESSPYLTDCCQIVKSGYQFNTKLMGKELQDLLQEYSVIHNLVNKKVGLLCKTSLLYKRIKLRCESLSEIIELILFWKYKNLKNEENSVTSEKTEKNSISFLNSTNSEFKSNCDVNSSKANNVNLSNNTNSYSNSNNETNVLHNSTNNISENFHSKLTNETYSKSKELIENEVTTGTRNEMQEIDYNTTQNRNSECMQMQISEISEEFQKNANENNSESGNDVVRNANNDNCNISIDNTDHMPMPELCLNSNVLTIDINSHGKDLVPNEVTTGSLETNEEAVNYENQIKIVRIEKENQNENHMVDSFSAPVRQNGGNMALENGSVVFVSHDVSNVTIGQDRNQIIVIPIDYYKSQNNVQNRMEIDDSQKRDFYHSKEIVEEEKNTVIFEGAQSTECSMTQFYSEEINKTPSVDENIITENDFLGNKQLMYNIEKELTRSSTRLQAQPTQQHLKNPIENVSLPPVATPLIVFSQAVIPKKPPRFRSILPKKKKPSPVHSVVVVQPLLESNQGLMKKISNKSESAGKKEVTRKVKKKVPLVQNHKNSGIERMENLNMPTIKTPISDKNVNDIKPEELEVADKLTNESTENADVKVTNEEKENLEKTESEKAETPVVVTRRNSKRLSLSTPRRKSHIRALEFETPPKKKEEKKSKTSPKVKVEHVITERKSVRNTLFKSPVPEITLKPPSVTKGSKKIMSETNVKGQESTLEPLNELSIPIATRSPNTKLSDAWENLTGVGCVIGQTDSSKASPTKKMWDADLRCFISESNQEVETVEKKRNRKPEKIQKDNRKNVRKKAIATKKSKSVPTMVSPSKMSLTAKRNTYSIKGNDEGSPLRSLLDDLKIVTPFKDIETIRPTEETPLTKLLRENVNTIDFDLSMINTPSFPPTPSIVITPDLDDISLISGANYYSPSKDFSKEKVFKITDYFRVDTEKASKKDTKEMHEKVIDDLVSKAKEIIGIGKENQEDCALKRRPSGKLLSMVKIQMLTQCDKKLCENIPINEETHFQNSSVDKNDCISNLSEEAVKSDLKEELEEKRKRALKKIKVVKENLSQAKNRVVTRSRKRKRSGFASGSNKKSVKSKSDGSNETTEEKNSSWSDESDRKVEVFHSTPYSDKKSGKPEKTDSNQKLDSEVLNDIRQELPLFEDAGDKYPELTEKSRKKIHYVESFLKLEEIVKFLEEFNETNPPKLNLKASFKRFFQVFYKWLKHPHKRELNASLETKALLKNYRLAFDKVNLGLNHRIRKLKKSGNVRDSMKVLYSPEESQNHSESKPHFSDDDEKEWRNRGNERKKDEDTEDGFVSILPLKKRKSTVQQVELKTAKTVERNDIKNCCTDNVSQTQNFLQDIDVDRFLSQIHGQANR